jgi:hypothetical protein
MGEPLQVSLIVSALVNDAGETYAIATTERSNGHDVCSDFECVLASALNRAGHVNGFDRARCRAPELAKLI